MVKDHLSGDHLWSGDHLQSGIIFSTVQVFNHTLCGSTPLYRTFKGVQPQGYVSGQ